MKKAVFGLANNIDHAERIVMRLQDDGFDNEVISVLFAERKSSGGYEMKSKSKKGSIAHEKHTKAPEGATTGALSGGIIGGSIGMLAGIGALAIPGLGPFIAAGPIMAALAGSAVGGSLGLLIGSLVGLGMPEYEAKKYEESLKSGGTLICVHADNSEDAERAVDLLKQEGARDISTSREKARSGH